MKFIRLLFVALIASFGSYAIGVITGPSTVCAGSSITLHDTTAGGTWSTISGSITIGATTGLVYGVSAGVAVVTYTDGIGVATTTVTVNPVPGYVTGTTGVCVGATTTLSDTTAGGVWSASPLSVGSVTSAGVVTGISGYAGVTITYTLPSGCYSLVSVSVTPTSIGAITVPSAMCVGNSTSLSSSTGGYFWSSSALVSVAGYSITALSAGTAAITYAVPTCSGISTSVAMVTVNPAPGAISGPGIICPSGTITLTDAVSGGTWTSSNTSVATIDLVTGVAVGIALGTTTVSYTTAGGCMATTVIIVGASSPSITGPSAVCLGSTITLTGSGGGTWSSGATTIASVGSISTMTTPVYGLSAGTATISYIVSGSCGGTAISTLTVFPAPAAITGGTSLCTSSTLTLMCATSGGTWSTLSTLVSVSSATGVVASSTTTGGATITYTTPGGCYTTAFVHVTSTGTTSYGGSYSLCVGAGINITEPVSGGTWSASGTHVSVTTTGGAFGVVSALTAGYDTVFYDVAGSCGTDRYVYMFTVLSSLPPITGGTTICVGSITTLACTLAGSWSGGSSAAAITGGAFGTSVVVTGVSAGTALITLSAGTGCVATAMVTVISGGAVITGPSSVCVGSSASFSGIPSGGTWYSSTLSVGLGSASGIITGASTGVHIISYTVGSCGSATTVLTVVPGPTGISGASTVCSGAAVTLINSVSGGTWSLSSTALATINAATGVLTPGATAGTVTVSYATASGCFVTSTESIHAAMAPIAGPSTLCIGSTGLYTCATTGGGWSSASVTVSLPGTSSGMVGGVSAGPAIITYSILGAAGCSTTTAITVAAGPVVTPGMSSICVGGTVTLSGSPAGGTWTSGSTITAVSGGVVTAGATSGVATISYTTSGSCSGTAIITVSPAPSITATATYGCGSVYTLHAGGGATYSWSPTTGLSCSTCPAPTVDPTSTISYVLTGNSTAGCTNTATVTINGNRIKGLVSFTTAATDTSKIWLVHFNPSDSSITAVDSTMGCNAGSGAQYYEFAGQAAGNYMVKAKIMGSIPGTSGYIPTYSLSTANWYSAASAAHTTGTDNLDINMIYGTVPSGPGFIGGYVYLGAGKGTSSGVANMLVLLKDASGNVITYTYTDGTGAYSFSSLAYGTYKIHPEDFQMYTTESTTIVLSASAPSVANVSFDQHPVSRTITPRDNTRAAMLASGEMVAVYPNPANGGVLTIQWAGHTTGNATVVMTDMLGREVYSTVVNIYATEGKATLNVGNIANGIYHLSIKSGDMNYNNKVQVQK